MPDVLDIIKHTKGLRDLSLRPRSLETFENFHDVGHPATQDLFTPLFEVSKGSRLKVDIE